MKIGLCLICTGKYEMYLYHLLDDVYKHFFLTDDVTVYLFTDKYHIRIDSLQPWIDRFEVIQLPISSYKFPEASLFRFRMFNEVHDVFTDEDYLYFMDVDMNIVADIGHDMLPVDEMVGVHHARCWSAEGTWEVRQNCRAYVPPEKRLVYYAGGVFGGTKDAFMNMSFELDRDIRKDHLDGLQAVWHDESYLNRYFADHPPTVLDPTYCFPPNPAPELSGFTDPKIVCIVKDHKKIRA